MNLYSFITHEEIESVSENIKNKTDFEIERECKIYQFRISSAIAGVDFNEETKKGDYIISIGFLTSTRGWGKPISGKELEKLKDMNNLREYIDKQLNESEIEGYEAVNKGQISLFEMVV